MNIRMNMERFDRQFHRFEHNIVMSSEKLVHQEAFWPITLVAIMVLALIMLMMVAQSTPTPRLYQGPFGPLY